MLTLDYTPAWLCFPVTDSCQLKINGMQQSVYSRLVWKVQRPIVNLVSGDHDNVSKKSFDIQKDVKVSEKDI